ncbi:MAG TPA: hypothetical protein ENH10_04640 [Bacteroidetes bacterium]|nr:hypothetical protein [Bacteroidota bacterium]HEX04428.1 hypothetical protein [Bacteroidota bacterium]
MIERSANGFDKCYFLFSSHENQPSSSSSGYSRFSLAFIESVKAAEGTTVRYKDVVDYIKDFYRTRGWQIPFIVIEADYTEVFCQKSDDLTLQLGDSTGLLSREIELTEDEILLHRIQEEAKLYCAEEELPKVPESIIQTTEETLAKNEFLKLLFTPETEVFSEYSELYHHNHVRDSMKKALNNFCVNEEHGLSQHGRWGYNLHPTVDTEIVGFRLKMLTKYPNVDGFMIEFSIFLSVSKIRCAYTFYRIIDKGLKKSLEMKDTLYFFDVSPHDEKQISDKLYQCIDEFEDYVKLVIKTKYSVQASDNDNTQEVESDPVIETEDVTPKD